MIKIYGVASTYHQRRRKEIRIIFELEFFDLLPAPPHHYVVVLFPIECLNILSWSGLWPAMLWKLESSSFPRRCYHFRYLKRMKKCEGNWVNFSNYNSQQNRAWIHEKLINIRILPRYCHQLEQIFIEESFKPQVNVVRHILHRHEAHDVKIDKTLCVNYKHRRV